MNVPGVSAACNAAFNSISADVNLDAGALVAIATSCTLEEWKAVETSLLTQLGYSPQEISVELPNEVHQVLTKSCQATPNALLCK